MSQLRTELAALALALQFMTRLPMPPGVVYTPRRANRSVHHYPLAGVLIGIAGALVYGSVEPVFASGLAVLTAVAAIVWFTGALHEDGLADLCDGLGGGRDRAQALTIMRDSRIGTYGVVGLGVTMALKVLALTEVPPGWVPWLLIAGHAASRASVVMVIVCSSYVRREGAASPVAGRQPLVGLLYAGAVAAAALALTPWALGLAVPGQALVAALGGLGVASVVVWRLYERRLGGYTGDCLGATQVVSETGLYLAVATVY